MQREEEERGELGGESLGAGDADLRAGVGGDGALGLAETAAPTTLQMAMVREPRAWSSRWAAMVSAVSPDWVMSRPMEAGLAMGER